MVIFKTKLYLINLIASLAFKVELSMMTISRVISKSKKDNKAHLQCPSKSSMDLNRGSVQQKSMNLWTMEKDKRSFKSMLKIVFIARHVQSK